MRIPPPFYFVAAMLLAVLLSAFVPLPIPWLPEGISSFLGNSLMILPGVLAIFSQRQLRLAKTGQLPGAPVVALVTTGPYSLSRNPIYLAWAIFQLGLGIWLRNAWLVVLLVPAIFIVNVLAIIPEERFLQDKFGQSFRDYQSRVRRWL